MTEQEARKMKLLESTLLSAYVDVDNLLVDIHPKPGPNGKVQWARTKKVRDYLRDTLQIIATDTSGTLPLVMETRVR